MMIPYLTESEFRRATKAVRMRESMRLAVRMVLVKRATWAKAAAEHRVTQAGMLKAMRRIRESHALSSGESASLPALLQSHEH